ncbi:MAG TPA: hypothetical protein VF808_01725 [Ktedonobacterales bacterium]
MLHQDRVHTLRQTHSAVSTLMPLITAGLTVTGALIAAAEARNPAASAEPRQERGSGEEASSHSATGAARRTARPGSIRRYIATLAGRLLLVLLGMGLVLAITFAATTTGRTGQAVIITALILLTLYLVEKAARRA